MMKDYLCGLFIVVLLAFAFASDPRPVTPVPVFEFSQGCL